MSSKGDSMKKSQLKSAILIALFILTISIEICPKITAPPPPIPDQFIADMFPNINNTNIHLLNISAIININATDLINEIGIAFDGSYILFNPESSANLSISLPFSLCFDRDITNFGVFVNETQVPFEIVSYTEENFTNTGVEINIIPAIDIHCPITLIISNLTLLENYTYVVNYQFEGSIPKPLSYRNLFYMDYSSDTAKLWKGNATERVEYNAFGGDPIFSTAGSHGGLRQFLDIAGGKRFISEWDNAQNKTIQIGIIFYGPTSEIIPVELIVFLAYVAITSVIVLWIIRRKKKRS